MFQSILIKRKPVPLRLAKYVHNKSLSEFWMPFTNQRQFKELPRLLETADGMYYRDAQDQQVLDGTSGLWCVNAGHRQPRVVDAIKSQLDKLDYAPNFQMGTSIAFECATKIIRELLHRDETSHRLERVFFTNCGSTAVDTAMKMALVYHKCRGEAGRVRFIGRERAYHGVGLGGISVGGIGPNRRDFAPLMVPNCDHLPHTHNLAKMAFSRGQPSWGAHLADELERMITLHDPSTVAAVMVEPVAGSTGVLVPPVGYLDRLREICSRHGILLIFDEVITGFGRTGKAFGADTFGVSPDIMCVAKGLTNGTVPCGAVFTTDDIYQQTINYANEKKMPTIEFFHGYTYSGHPLAMAAAIASIDAFLVDGIFKNGARHALYWEDSIHSLRGIRHVNDIRNIGIMGAIDLEPIPGQPGARAYKAFVTALKKGLLIRVTGDTIALSPPLILDKSHIDELFGILADVLTNIDE